MYLQAIIPIPIGPAFLTAAITCTVLFGRRKKQWQTENVYDPEQGEMPLEGPRQQQLQQEAEYEEEEHDDEPDPQDRPEDDNVSCADSVLTDAEEEVGLDGQISASYAP